MKYIFTSAICFILFVLYTLYAPVFYAYHVEKYSISEGGQFCMFWGFVAVGFALVAGTAIPIKILSDEME